MDHPCYVIIAMLFKEHPEARNVNINNSMQISLVYGDTQRLKSTSSALVACIFLQERE